MSGDTLELLPATDDDRSEILAVINDGASAYRGHIPADRWHEPYMTRAEIDAEIAAGVRFSLGRKAGRIVGVMGIQDVRDVTLIRHAYVRTDHRSQGIGGRLLRHLVAQSARPILIGTWKAAEWAIAFYQRHGFAVVSEAEKDVLLRTYWTIPDRQIETSVVLVDGRWRSRRS